MTHTQHRIGIDIGGSKTALILLNERGQTLHSDRRPNAADRMGNVTQIAAMVAQARQHTPMPVTIGVGMPGLVCPTRKMVTGHIAWLRGHDFIAALEQALGQPVHVQNDAKCFALSESVDGAGATFHTALYIILGTGVGGAIMTNGHIIGGMENACGEWGQMIFPRHKDGKLHTIEQIIAGPAFEKNYATHSGAMLAATDIAAKAAKGDTVATTCLEEWLDDVAMALAQVTNFLMPNGVVIGGGLSRIDALYTTLPARLKQYSLFNCTPTIKQAVHGDASGVRGAAFLGARP